MPSEKVLLQKQQIVADLAEKLQNAVTGVVVNYSGITVADDTKLRKDLREANVEYFVVKNTLLKRAAQKAEVEIDDSVLEGTTALAISDTDYASAAKIITEFAKTSKTYEVKAGFCEGKALDVKGVEGLSKLPAKEVLIAQVLGGLNAPIAGFAGVLNATLTGLVVALNAIAEKQSAE